jgi:hypothetical protein
MRRKTYAGLLGGAAGTTFLWRVFLREYDGHDLPSWTRWTVLGLAAVTVVVLMTRLVLFLFDHDRNSAATPRTGQVSVCGAADDVRQQCLAALRGMGARAILIDGPRILAYTGIGVLFRNWFMGEVIWVTISPRGELLDVQITSTKADFVSRSRSDRNLSRFLESWSAFPPNRR